VGGCVQGEEGRRPGIKARWGDDGCGSGGRGRGAKTGAEGERIRTRCTMGEDEKNPGGGGFRRLALCGGLENPKREVGGGAVFWGWGQGDPHS